MARAEMAKATQMAKTTHSMSNQERVGREGPLEDQKDPCFVRVLGRRGLLPVSGRREQRVAAIAQVQRGRVSRRQLLAAGLAPTTIKKMVRCRLLDPEYSGVYAVAYAPPVPLARETAALLACHGRAVLSHRSAAALWDLLPPVDAPVEVTVVRGESGRKRAGLRLHRASMLAERDTSTHQWLPVTSPARTLLDIASCNPERLVERALDAALVVKRIVVGDDLDDVVQRAGTHRGKALLRDLLYHRGGSTLTESEAEERFLDLIRKAGLPTPETQVIFNGYRIDFLWRDLGVVFEVDGYTYHSSRSAFNRDRLKDAALKSAGLDPNHVTRDEIEFRPLAVIAFVAGALARRSVRRWVPEEQATPQN